MKDLYLIGAAPGWLIGLISLGAAALLVQQFFGLRQRLPLGQTSFLIFLRACVYAVLLFFLFGPALIDKRVSKLRRPLTLLIDSSQSMGFPASAKNTPGDKPGQSRLDLVREKLQGGKDPLIQRLNRDYDLRVISFGTTLDPIAPASIANLKAQAPGSRLLELLQTAARDGGAQSGIVVFSDGITNGERKSLDGAPPLPVPVFTVGVGESEGFTDVRIAKLGAPEFAFRGREFKIDLTIQASGMKGKSVPLFFNRGKNLITTRTVAIDADSFEQKVTLSFTPKELGTHGFSVSIPAQPGEQITQNNHKDFKVDVQRDKIRVLTLSGSPSWNYRFLRMAMKQDPLIELVSFVFLRTPMDTVDVPESQLSLIPFPIDDIFLEELKNFDVIFFDNFSYRAYFNPVYLERVRDFVRDGGGLAMLGGSRSFDAGGYGESALREVLPVELDGKGNYQSQTTVSAALSATGKVHPVTRLLPEPKSNEEAWSKLPALTGLNQVRGVRGETLITAGGDGAPTAAPLLPTRQASVQLRVVNPEGEPTLVSVAADSEEGEYTGEFTPTKEGTHRVEAEASLGGKVLGKDKTSFGAAFSYGETDDGRPRLDLLKQIAESSKGEYFAINDWDQKAVEKIAARLESVAPSEIVERRQTRLWSNVWPFAIILAMLSAEWWMRRKWGLI